MQALGERPAPAHLPDQKGVGVRRAAAAEQDERGQHAGGGDHVPDLP